MQKHLDEDRYEHTIGVMYTCSCTCNAYTDDDLKKAQVAGLLHDCAKCIPNEKKLKICEKTIFEVSDFEKRSSPFLLHAKLGAYIAKAKYNVDR